MRADPGPAALQRLSSLQQLRLAADTLALDDARQARLQTARHEGETLRALHQQEAELADLLGSGRFDPVSFAMLGEQLVTQANQYQTAQTATGRALAQEQIRQQQWRASRYQRDWLEARCRAAARKQLRKQDERAALDAASLALAYPKGTPA